MLGMQGTEEEIMSYQLEEEATDFALMAFTSNPSSSNSELDEALREKEDLKAKLEKFETSSKNLTKPHNSQISAKVKTGLGYDSQFNEKEVLDVKEEEVTETVFDNCSSDEENSLVDDRFKKGEGFYAVPPHLTRNYMPPKPDILFFGLDDSIYKFKITQTVTSLSKDIKDAPKTSIAFVEKLKKLGPLDEALREKEDLKAKLKNFETSLKNLTKVLDTQISAKVKTGLGYDSHFHEKEVLDIREEEVTETVFDNLSSDEENSLANDRFKKGEGYHVVPPPLIGNYMPPKPDLSFVGQDDSIYKFKISETGTSLAKDDKDAPETSTASVEKPKEDRSSAPLIQDWDIDSDNDSVFRPKPIPAKIDFVKAVFTRSGRIPVSAAKPKAAASTTAAKLVNTAGPKQNVNFSKSRSTFHKSHSPIRRSFYNATTHSRRNSTKRVNTAGSEAVSAVKRNGVT
nr:hypothetical protein [Tanacetum cinerariifolium]